MAWLILNGSLFAAILVHAVLTLNGMTRATRHAIRMSAAALAVGAFLALVMMLERHWMPDWPTFVLATGFALKLWACRRTPEARRYHGRAAIEGGR